MGTAHHRIYCVFVSSGRVLVLVKGLGIGGAEQLIAASAPCWADSSFEYEVAYVLPWKDQLVQSLTDHGVEVTCVGGARGTSPATTGRLRRLLRDRSIDMIHAHLPATGILARLSTRLPVVYTEHNLATSYRLPTRLLNRLTYGRNRAVTAVSTAVADSLTGYRGPVPLVVENGVEVSGVTPIGRDELHALGVEEGARLVVHVGNIRPHKGQATLLEAARILATTRSDLTILSIGGEKHEGDLERLRRQAQEMSLAGTIRFLGRRVDARRFIAAADLYVNPADVEGLPVSILEAQALGVPVVATRVGGVPSVVVDGVTGRLVPPADPVRLATAILDVIDLPDRGRSLAEKAQQLIADSYGIQRMVRRFEAIYTGVLRSRR